MKFLKTTLVLTAFSLFVFACSQTSTVTNNNSPTNSANSTVLTNNSTAANTPAPPDELAAARKIYAESCVACHKENGEGGAVEADGKKFKVPSYKADKVKNATDEKLLDYIVNGDDEMPSFKGKLTDDEMKSLVKFIRKEFQGK